MESRNTFGRSILRACLCLSLFGAVLGSTSPGAIVASLAVFGDDHAHNVSIQRDTGHDDLVLCHGSEAVSGQAPSEIRPYDCTDDHRIHVANVGEAAVRVDARVVAAPVVAVASSFAPIPVAIAMPRDLRTDFDPALASASRRHQTVVLRL